MIRDGRALQVILAATPEATVDGVYGFFFDGGRGHARIGRILSYSPAERTVLREVESVYSGDSATARRGWWSGAAYPDPAALGLPVEDVLIDVDGGTAPAWLVRAVPVSEETAPDVWAIMVHGRGASRQEGLRAVRTARELGMSSLLISYRNDGLAPSASDGRYGLGSTEWRDVETAIEYALQQGAREVVLFGWSMGGAICLQTADLSRHRQVIRAMVLDAPVINWVNVLAHHAELNRIPSAVGRYGQLMLGHPLGRRLTAWPPRWTSRRRTAFFTGRGAAHADPHCAQRGRRIRPLRAFRRAGREEPGDGHVRVLRHRPAHEGMECGSGALGTSGHGLAPVAAGAPCQSRRPGADGRESAPN